MIWKTENSWYSLAPPQSSEWSAVFDYLGKILLVGEKENEEKIKD